MMAEDRKSSSIFGLRLGEARTRLGIPQDKLGGDSVGNGPDKGGSLGMVLDVQVGCPCLAFVVSRT